MKNIKFQAALAMVCVVLGLMLAIQFRTVKQGIGPISDYRARELASQLKKMKEEREGLLDIKNQYEKKIKEYEDAASQGNNSAKILKDQLDNARIMAGLEDVVGPGITVVLDDLKFGEQNNYAMIDYVAILEMINELNAAGAEAISINDQRVISTTEVRQAGDYHININTVKFAPPFTVKAIGDSKTLEAALRIREGSVDKLEYAGIFVDIKPQQNLIIKKYDGIIERKYSKVLKEGEPQ